MRELPYTEADSLEGSLEASQGDCHTSAFDTFKLLLLLPI